MINHDDSDSEEKKRKRREEREKLKAKIKELERRRIEHDQEIAQLKEKLSEAENTKKKQF